MPHIIQEFEGEWRAEGSGAIWIVRNNKRVLCTMTVGPNAERDAHKVACIQALLDFCDDVSNCPAGAYEIFKERGFVFDETGGRWEKLAFTLYTMIAGMAAMADQLVLEAQVLPLPEFGQQQTEV